MLYHINDYTMNSINYTINNSGKSKTTNTLYLINSKIYPVNTI